MEVNFITKKVGLDVTFRNQSTEVPKGTTYLWDFGDGSEVVTETSPIHTYPTQGFYTVTTTVNLPGVPDATTGELILPKPTVLVTYLALSDMVKTTLPGSIYTLINHYIPTGIVGKMPFTYKQSYIEKWQLYIHPLVNHEITAEDYNDELYYEALENQLVMESAALDYLTTALTNLLQAKSNTESSETSDTTTTEGNNIKKITTGPTEVEYHDQGKTSKDIVSNAIKAMQPGGILDTLRNNICNLSLRLDIYLPFCKEYDPTTIPSINTRRSQTGLRGPNPTIIHT